MRYLPRKIIQEEINKVNPLITFTIRLSSNRFNLYKNRAYFVKFFLGGWCYPLPIKDEIIKLIKPKEFRAIIRATLEFANETISKRYPVKPYTKKELEKRYYELKHRKKIKDIMDWEIAEFEAIREHIKMK